MVSWPRSTLKASADALEGVKIADDTAHDIPDDGEIPTRPPAKTIIGEITSAEYRDGVGVVYEGEIDDPDIARSVENDRLDVSPFVFRKSRERDDGVKEATEITKWRDLATVETGASEGASIEAAAAAQQSRVDDMAEAEALGAAVELAFDDVEGVDADALEDFSHLQYSGTTTGGVDVSNMSSDSYRGRFLFPASTKSDSSFPVVTAGGQLSQQAVDSAWKLRGHAPVPNEEMERILGKLADNFDNPPIPADALAAGAADDPSNSGEEADADALKSDNSNTNMQFGEESSGDADGGEEGGKQAELSETEASIISTVRGAQDSADKFLKALKMLASGKAQITEQSSDPESMYAAPDELGEVKGVFADALTDQSGLGRETVESLGLSAMVDEFRDDDGELEAEALVQNPETGGVDDPNPDAEADPLSEDDLADLSDELDAARDAQQFNDDETYDRMVEQAAEKAGVDESAVVEVI